MIRLIIADDHQIVIDGIKQLLEKESGMVVIGEANNGQQLLQLIASTPTDLVLLDVDMPVLNGIEACKKIAQLYPKVKVIALTMMNEASIIRKMLKAGAKGYLMKNTGKEELTTCIQAIYTGKTFYSPEVAKVILSDLSGNSNQKNKNLFPSISRREKQILKMIIDEFTTAEIAEQLYISFGTVETHRRNIMNKLGARNTAGMVRIAIENKLLDS